MALLRGCRLGSAMLERTARERMDMKTALQPRNDRWLEEDVNLTDRQRQILNLVSLGHTNKEIANITKISVRTVEVHRFNLMRRLHVRNVAQLLGRALHLGLL